MLTKHEINEIMRLIDVEAELQQFDWPGANWSQDKLIARSPFREDQSPSFFVNLTGDYKGAWGDSGATDDRYSKGGWFRLIAHLRGISVDEVVDEYRGLLAQRTTTTELPKFKIRLRSKAPVPKPDLHPPATATTTAPCDYLQERGISTKVSGALRVSYDPARKAIVIPWYDSAGTLVAMKYRSVRDKRFWYSPGGRPISELIYGIDRVHKRRFKTVFVTEAEIDAMSIMTAGFPAIATGGAAIGRAKIDVLRGSPVERYVLVPDGDAAGERWAAELERELKGYAEIRVLRLGEALGHTQSGEVRGLKDANDALMAVGCVEFRHKLEKYHLK